MLTGTDLCHQNTDSERPGSTGAPGAPPPVAENLPAGAEGAHRDDGFSHRSERSLEWEVSDTFNPRAEAWQPKFKWGLKESDSTERARPEALLLQAPVIPSPGSLGGWSRAVWTPGALFGHLRSACLLGCPSVPVPSSSLPRDEPRLSICEVDLRVQVGASIIFGAAYIYVGRCFPLSG